MSKNLIGKKFGEYTVLDSTLTYTKAGNPRTHLKVRCSCGEVYERERSNVVKSKHPMCHFCRSGEWDVTTGSGHPRYRTWRGMVNRCYLQTAQHYSRYGGRGIKVCGRWLGVRKFGETASIDGFRNFCADMGPKPTKSHSIDRKDNDGPYSPENCRWATPEEQSGNKVETTLVTLAGWTHSLHKWAALTGVPSNNVYSRLRKGIPPKEALLDVIAKFSPDADQVDADATGG